MLFKRFGVLWIVIFIVSFVNKAESGQVLSADLITIVKDNRVEHVPVRFKEFETFGQSQAFAFGSWDYHQQECFSLDAPFSFLAEKDEKKYRFTIKPKERVCLGSSGFLIVSEQEVAVDHFPSVEKRDRIFAEYFQKIEASKPRLKAFQRAIEEKKYKKARKVYSKLNYSNLFPSNLLQVEKLWKRMPWKQRPLPAHNEDFRQKVRWVQKRFGKSDKPIMTYQEYVAEVEKWAVSPPASGNIEWKEWYILNLLISLELEDSVKTRILIGAIQTRFNLVLGLAASDAFPVLSGGFKYHLERAVLYLEKLNHSDGLLFLQSLRNQIQGKNAVIQRILNDTFLGARSLFKEDFFLAEGEF